MWCVFGVSEFVEEVAGGFVLGFVKLFFWDGCGWEGIGDTGNED